MGNTNSSSTCREFRDISNISNGREYSKDNEWLDYVTQKLSSEASEYYWAGMLVDTIRRLVAAKPFQWKNAAKMRAHIKIKNPRTIYYIKKDLDSPISCIGTILELFKRDFLFDSNQNNPIEGIKAFIQIMVETIFLFYSLSHDVNMKEEITYYLMQRLITRNVLQLLYENNAKRTQDLQKKIEARDMEIVESFRLKARRTLSVLAKDNQDISVEFKNTEYLLDKMCKSEDIFKKIKYLESFNTTLHTDIKKGLKLSEFENIEIKESEVIPYMILSTEVKELVGWIEVLSELQSFLEKNSKFVLAVQRLKSAIFKLTL